jgi:hypothetical protein
LVTTMVNVSGHKSAQLGQNKELNAVRQRLGFVQNFQ